MFNLIAPASQERTCTGAETRLAVPFNPQEARRRKVELVVLPTAEAIGVLTGTAKDTNAVLHLTC